MAGAGASGTAAQVERKAIQERDGLRATAGAAPTLAHRCFLYQHCGHVLLPLLGAGRLQPVHCALGSAAGDDGGRHRDHPAGGAGAVPGRQAADHLRQRAAVHRPGLQGVHPHCGHDARAHSPVLSAIERQNRALAQIAQKRVHPARHAAHSGGRPPADPAVCGPLQHGAPPQRDWLRDPGRYAGRPPERDPRRPRPQVGGGAAAAAAAPPAQTRTIGTAPASASWTPSSLCWCCAASARTAFCLR